MKNICVIGSGHVGLVTGTCLAELGNRVICMDDDSRKIEGLKKGAMPFYEPGLEEMVYRNVNNGRLSFTTDIKESVKEAQIVFICVGTPQKPNGEADLSYVEAVSRRIAEAMNSYKVIVEKSTVLVKTGSWAKKTIGLNNSNFDVVSNPEFLREGKAIHDFMHPDRIVIGVESEQAANIMTELYKPLNAPILVTNIETAQLIKHASNAFLALKISYINAIANICEKVGADVVKVAEGMGYDKRIGRDFLDAGIGYGGYCFPKDLAAFIRIAEQVGYKFELLKVVQEINENQRRQIVKKARSLLWNLDGQSIGILGLSFKPNTDDMREAPSINIIRQLQEEGVKIKAYDPRSMENAGLIFQDVEFCQDPYQVAEGSDALIIVTEWEEFNNLDLLKVKSLLKQPVIIDGRNIFEPAQMKKLGFIYQGVGR
ncbi:UDP-glucose/GDP-mannose dehydrogenase family protein [Dehalococcoidia bacterium]|nr:UDP-glucose/GDP-mannose dehydrogenase family protein [Dehalococcoidia bacterium]